MVRIFGPNENNRYVAQSLKNNWNDSLRCIIFGTIRNTWREDPRKSRPDYHQTTRAIVSMNKEAGLTQEPKRRHNHREDLNPRKLDWLTLALSHLEMVLRGKPNRKFSNSAQRLHRKSAEAHALGNRETFIHDDRWNTNWWTTPWWEKSRWKWNDEV